MIYETQEQLDAALAEWQKILRLKDWRIQAMIVRKLQLGDGKSATILIHACERLARIMILDPLDYDPNSIADQDHENDLVHELSHIHTQRLRYAETEDEHHAGEELAVCSFTDALLKLKRQIPNA